MSGKQNYPAKETLTWNAQWAISEHHKKIFASHYNKSTAELAREFKLSVRRIREIIWRTGYLYYMEQTKNTAHI